MRFASDRWKWTLEMTDEFIWRYLENLKAKRVSEEREMKGFTIISNWYIQHFSPSGFVHLSSRLSLAFLHLLYLTSVHGHTCIPQKSPSFPSPLPLSKLVPLPLIHILPRPSWWLHGWCLFVPDTVRGVDSYRKPLWIASSLDLPS